MQNLAPDEFLEFIKDFYDAGLSKFGDSWEYADINTFLLGVSHLLSPESYLEIGVRRGRSACMVASQSPEVDIVGFDMWIKDYAGMPNPGEVLVSSELKNIGHRGNVEFHPGDSKMTVPKYFAANPDKFFDLITVDGDHSVDGARQDLENVIPRLKTGGVLVFDDTCNQDHPGLNELWNSLVVNNPIFAAHTFNDVGFGVGMAVRRA
jgi:predicted O-methyltransferase YrrM